MMKRCLLYFAAAITLFAASSVMSGQAMPAATRSGQLQAGIEISNANTDEFDKRITGITGYATFDFRSHFGVEVDYHSLTLGTPDDYSQSSFEGGIRYYYPYRERYVPYAKLMAGVLSINQNQPYYGKVYMDSFNMYSIGGGLDYKLKQFHDKITIRAIDFELQKAPGFPPHGISPSIISVGVAYRIR